MVIKLKPHIKKIILNEILIHPLLLILYLKKIHKSWWFYRCVSSQNVANWFFVYIVFYSNIGFSCQIVCSGLWDLCNVPVESEH